MNVIVLWVSGNDVYTYKFYINNPREAEILLLDGLIRMLNLALCIHPLLITAH